jgi:hypothetical protein
MVRIRSNSGKKAKGSTRIQPWQIGLFLLILAYCEYVALESSTTTAPTTTAKMQQPSARSGASRSVVLSDSTMAKRAKKEDIRSFAGNDITVKREPPQESRKVSETIRAVGNSKTTAQAIPPNVVPASFETKPRIAVFKQHAKTAAVKTEKPAPRLVLHVGPPKTGTTSLQYMLKLYESQLRKDGYYYTGNETAMSDFRLCLKRIKKAGGPVECWTDIVDGLERHRLQGQSVILSNEIFSWYVRQEPIFWKLVQEALRPWLPHLTVVVGYRHLHNFLPSTHYEVQKSQRWPSQIERGKYVTPLTKFWRERFHREEQLVGPMPTPAAVLKQFQNANYTVSMLDIERNEQIEEFLCQVLPNAPQTCQYHAEQKRNGTDNAIPSLNKNDAGQVNYDSLALIAFQQDLLKAEQTRKYLRQRVKSFNEVTWKRGPNDFPLDCLTDSEDAQFLQESLQHAHASGFTSKDMDDELTLNFYKTKANKKFCSINATLAFEEKRWYNFFHNAKNW